MLRVYKASAGSGKTYTLVKEYLRLALLAPDKFKHILAITFTNKAAAEMKGRVLEALEGIAQAKPKYTDLTEELSSLLGRQPEILRTEASMLSKNMLHNYADISISTIDSFVHRIVRSFAHDLRLSMSFDIEMDSGKILEDAVELLLDSLNEADPQITQAVIEFAESKIEDGKSWNIELEIARLGRELFVDDALPYISKLHDVSLDDLREARKALYARRNFLQQELCVKGKEAVVIIERAGLTPKDFHQGARGIYGYFNKWAEGDFPEPVQGNSYVVDTIENDKWGKSGTVGEGMKQQLREMYTACIDGWNKHSKDYFLCELLLKNFFSFILLADLQKLMDELKRDENFLYIGDFQHRVYEIVSQQDAPVIYERIGERYDNILIDEFQDTSVVQWHNLLPLIENSQFKSEDSLIVGDSKQAIYRFRGGEVEQFAALPQVPGSDYDEVLKGREVAINNYGVEVINLEKNYRSRKEIVDFNNSLYKVLLDLPELRNKAIYADFYQETGTDKTGGFVSLEFLKASPDLELTLEDERCLRVKAIVDGALQRGYSLRDVAVLTRSNSNAAVIADYLVRQGIKVISPESLLIHQSPKVRLLLSSLAYLNKKDDRLTRAELLHYAMLVQGNTVAYESVDFNNLSVEFEIVFRETTGTAFNSTLLNTGRLSDLVQQLLGIFGLDDDDPFVQFFADEVLLFASRYGNNITEFLRWWDDVRDKKSIIYPESMDAVRIMTIHKSKGLQFPVVILADAEERKKLTKNFFWVRLNKPWLPQLNVGIIPANKEVKHTDFAAFYEKEDEHSFLDMLNLFYVGTTRPEDALYVLSSELQNEPSEANSVTALVLAYLKGIAAWEGFQTYTFGNAAFTKAENKKNKTEDNLYRKQKTIGGGMLISGIKVKTRAEQLWSEETVKSLDKGKLLHEALNQVRYAGNETDVVRRMLAQGTIGADEHNKVLDKLKQVVTHPDIADYFNPEWQVLNERPLLKAGAKVRVPDRVVVKGNDAVLIEYKTGAERTDAARQVNDYAKLLTEVGLQVQKKIVFYTELQKAEVVP